MTPLVCLTIAGSDSGGGAGIQADLKAFSALGVFGTTAITAVTAQNTVGVDLVHVVPPEVVDAQISAVLDDLGPLATKTGMLATAANVAAVARRAVAGDLPNLVVDPVMVASTGARLLDEEAERTYLDLLIPHALVVTPNLYEASLLVGRTLTTVADMADAAAFLRRLGAKVAVVKGGHLEGPVAVDVVDDGAEVRELRRQRVPTENVHGTGCTLSAATAAHLARGAAPMAAVEEATRFVARAIAGGARWHLGKGHGPLDPFGWEPPGEVP
ncbi:MAG: bifunctional hydroxymethylpyrimidine kinase/phosphomethylpyrimidine kinase [Acidimicrobiales bacterium]|nr:bifunctional hydroxymethylpyrimidine kinase/phosphomethylpyrimidine kinase [Acidimicrobiales bacterium]MBO0894226.1 bifunctional hydroxymethylpyrimidine kinase/phosphomethylpyrimidine kinase [Acidimicrobiales bacterium]